MKFIIIFMYFCGLLTLNNCMGKFIKYLIFSVLLLNITNCTTKLPEKPKEIDSDFVEDYTFETVVTITFTDGMVSVSPASIPQVSFTIDNGNIVVNSTKKHVEYRLTGSTNNGSFKLYSNYRCKLTLDEVSITSYNTPAINIQTGKTIFVVLEDDTENILKDKEPYNTPLNEDAKGTFFSEGQLIFSGSGSLSIGSKQAHGISCDDYIRIRSGEIRITEAAKDGINAKQYILIEGGNIIVSVQDDGISCREGHITIKNGTITIDSMDEGIVAGYNPDEEDTPIPGVVPDITINGGEITITTYGERGHGIKSVGLITFNGGTTTITTLGDKADGIDSDGGTVTINAGTLVINAKDDCMNTTPIINGGDYTCID